MSGFDAARFQALRQGAFGRDLRCFDAIASTQDAAREALNRGAREGVVILAESQSAGRGRWGHRWQASPGQGLLLTVILAADAGVSVPSTLPLLLGLATAQALQSLGVTGLGLKWPNDLWWQQRKLGGLLVESAAGQGLAGLGLNVSQADADFDPALQGQAVSLAQAGFALERETVLAAILLQWEKSLQAWREQGPAAWSSAWDALDALKGRPCRAETPQGPVEGLADGVDPDGALRLIDGDGRLQRMQSAELSLLRPLDRA